MGISCENFSTNLIIIMLDQDPQPLMHRQLHHLHKKILKEMVQIIPEMLEMPVDGIGKTGLIIGRNTMQNNNNKDQIIFKTMKEVKYSMKMMSLFCCNELEKKSQKILLRQLVLLLSCFPF